jgi:hypothetical protein
VRNRFDQLGKKIGLEALGPSGLTVAHDEIAPDAHHADLRHEPDPARAAERVRLGLLGRIASILCLIEIYSGAPDEDEALACLGKLIAFRQKRRRDARKKKRKQLTETFVRPFVWIITAGRPTSVLAALAAIPAPGWPRGVYFSPGVLVDADGTCPAGLDGAGGLLRVGIVVASELPRERSTILVRLMAAGPVLPGAIADLSALPEDAHEHAVASQILLALQHALGSKPKRTPEEQEFIVSMQNIAEKLVEKGRKEGRDEGRLTQARAAVRRVLATRKLAPSPADEARIDACTDLVTLERWLDQALTARSPAEALRGSDAGTTRARRQRATRSL